MAIQGTGSDRCSSFPDRDADHRELRSPIVTVLCVYHDLLFLDRICKTIEKFGGVCVEISVSVDDALRLMVHIPVDIIVTDCTVWQDEPHGFLKILRTRNNPVPFIYFYPSDGIVVPDSCSFSGVHFVSWDRYSLAGASDELHRIIHTVPTRIPLSVTTGTDHRSQVVHGSTGRITVLYVDDEPDLLDIVKTFFEKRESFVVRTATSVREALALLRTWRCDVVISDYQMPEIDGITFLKILRASFGEVPFILFTGNDDQETVSDALKNGADYYLHKGCSEISPYAELENRVRRLVERKRS